jgi:methylenetetrahydrofolate reductase (NADPH)
MNISFEIVPRSQAAFDSQYAFVESLGAAITVINVPDIQRFSIRSWETQRHIDRDRYCFIPHLRAIDFAQDGGELFRIIEQYQLSHLLLVSGDPPEVPNRSVYNTDVVELLKKVHQRYPQLQLYAGFDPHRQGLQDECHYIQRKIDAGVSGFFSQPFYDTRLIEIYADHLQGLETYIGLSPITSMASKHYWEVKNKVKFPSQFRPDYDWNIAFANQVMAMAPTLGIHIYFMPIRIDLAQYFSQLQWPH